MRVVGSDRLSELFHDPAQPVLLNARLVLHDFDQEMGIGRGREDQWPARHITVARLGRRELARAPTYSLMLTSGVGSAPIVAAIVIGRGENCRITATMPRDNRHQRIQSSPVSKPYILEDKDVLATLDL
jgi:hypothetical protein